MKKGENKIVNNKNQKTCNNKKITKMRTKIMKLKMLNKKKKLKLLNYLRKMKRSWRPCLKCFLLKTLFKFLVKNGKLEKKL